MKTATPPIVVADKNGNDLIVFETVIDAQGYLEPIDVQNGEHIVFDIQGRVLTQTIHGTQVFLSLPDHHETRLEELTKRAQSFLTATGALLTAQSETNVRVLVAACKNWQKMQSAF